MTALPPAGWYPDPEAAGTTWRWWDGTNWSPPAYGYGYAYGYAYGYGIAPAVVAESYRNATTKFGKWLRWAMLANYVALVVAFVAFGLAFRGNGLDFAPGDSGPFSGRFLLLQLAFLPLNVASLADRGLLIAWMYQAGKFAEARGWPAARGRVLGAFSVLIPVVSLWWPYEAVRDAYPPGSSQPFLLEWWVSYLVAPIIGLPVFLAALFGTPLQIVIAIAVAACVLVVPVWFGWKLIADVEAMQRANSPADV
jgi:hypothetical protein